MSAAVDAMVKALKALADHDTHAAEVFVNQLYVAMMQHEYTRFGIERTGEEFVKLGLETPTELDNAMGRVRYKVRKDSEGLWTVQWRKGIWTTVASFASFKNAHDYVRDLIYGEQDDYAQAR